jgi:hypothetical protein
MSMNFNNLVNTKMDQIERPPNIPVGTYRCAVKKPPNLTNSNDGKWEIVDFPLQLIEAVDGVDEGDLKTYGGLGPNSVVNKKFMFNTEDDSAFKRTQFDLKRFLIDHLKCADESMDMKQGINASLNAQCLVFVKWVPDKDDPEIQYSNAGKTAPID